MTKNIQNRAYALGLDIGIASVGAAALAGEKLLGLHVRAFDKAETEDKGEPLNKIRREARLARRRLARRRYRLQRLRRLFHRTGLIDNPTPESFANVCAWELRAVGLVRLLTGPEWAAALYHMVRHRGFQSTRKSEAKSDEKAGQMLTGVSRNQALLRAGGYRTVGEMVCKDAAFQEAKRNKGGDYSHTFDRKDLAHELETLFECQRTFGNPHTGEDFAQAVYELLMQRRPALAGEALLDKVGRCTFEKTEYRAPQACYTTEYFVWLTRLNNLRLVTEGDARPLDAEERARLLGEPFQKTKLTYAQVRKLLDLPADTRFVGLRYPSGKELSQKDPETGALFEAKAYHALRKAYEDAGLRLEWARDSQNPARLDDLGYALTVFKEDSAARAWLAARGVEENIIEAALTESFSKFKHLSLKALRKIVPQMETGLRYDEAVQAAGYAHHSQLPGGEKQRYLPRFTEEEEKSITNPVVRRALNQARKLVNAMIRVYGPPSAVHIELARDLNRPLDEREKIKNEQKKYREAREADREAFIQQFDFEPKGQDLQKWSLYREQDAKCAYSLQGFDLSRLFEAGYAEIDHALPRSRSFDNSKNNTVLVFAKENRNKGNRTPYEYFGGDSERWQGFTAWVESNPKYRQAKKTRLLRKDFGEKAAEEFRERNLTDTRYACRYFKNFVEQHLQLAEGAESEKVVVVSGQLTAFLRARWGLLKVREAGDLHHALDAAVVAACSRGMVKRLADDARREELRYARTVRADPESGEIPDIAALRKLEKDFPVPYPGFRKELLARLSPDPAALGLAGVAPVRVSRAPLRRGSGAAHKDTIRSAKYLAQGKSVVKTPLSKLKLKTLPDIVGYGDPRNQALIAALEQRLRAHGDDEMKAFAQPFHRPGAEGKEGLVVRAVRVFSPQKSGLPVRSGIAANSEILRLDVFWKNKKFFAVPLYVADMGKELPNKAALAKKSEAEWPEMDETYRFLFSLHKNDWVRVTQKGKTPLEGYFASFDRANVSIDLWAHDRNRAIVKDGKWCISIKTALSVEKFHVDLLGGLHPARPEQRLPLCLMVED